MVCSLLNFVFKKHWATGSTTGKYCDDYNTIASTTSNVVLNIRNYFVYLGEGGP